MSEDLIHAHEQAIQRLREKKATPLMSAEDIQDAIRYHESAITEFRKSRTQHKLPIPDINIVDEEIEAYQASYADGVRLDKTERIRQLNDDFRTTFSGGQVAFTQGINALGEQSVFAIMKRVREYDDFTESNDPHLEHDFGSFEQEGRGIFWKIDYYDKICRYGSEDPSDPKETTRILTVMLASEY